MTQASDIPGIEQVEIDCTGMAFGGEAVGRWDGQVVFVPYALPGERALIEIQRHKKRYVRARILELHRRSPMRITAPCPYFQRCGGCQWQHADYQAQLEFKHQVVVDQLRHIGSFPDPVVHPTLPSPDVYHYRNQARFSIGRGGVLGFTQLHSRRFIPIDYCYLMHPRINEVLASIQGKAEVLHQVSIRHGYYTDDLLITPRLPPDIAPFPTRQDYYEEILCGRRFRISSASFFQVNTRQAERMVEIVRQYLDLQGDETLIDAYSGVGTFALLFADRVRQVVGIEESRTAIADAELNRLGTHNVRFCAGKVEGVLPELGEPADMVLIDPARVGCHPAAIGALLSTLPRRIIYVSCDPSTLARDLKALCEERYRLVQVQPVDMFPHTYHIECVAQVDLI